jgi:hypothetical protein
MSTENKTPLGKSFFLANSSFLTGVFLDLLPAEAGLIPLHIIFL